MKQSDFTVLTSKSESFGLVVVESFILKKPVVVAEYPAIYEIMEDGKQGIVAEQSVEGLTAGVKKMIENCGGIRERRLSFLETTEINNSIAYNQFVEAVER